MTQRTIQRLSWVTGCYKACLLSSHMPHLWCQSLAPLCNLWMPFHPNWRRCQISISTQEPALGLSNLWIAGMDKTAVERLQRGNKLWQCKKGREQEHFAALFILDNLWIASCIVWTSSKIPHIPKMNWAMSYYLQHKLNYECLTQPAYLKFPARLGILPSFRLHSANLLACGQFLLQLLLPWDYGWIRAARKEPVILYQFCATGKQSQIRQAYCTHSQKGSVIKTKENEEEVGINATECSISSFAIRFAPWQRI